MRWSDLLNRYAYVCAFLKSKSMQEIVHLIMATSLESPLYSEVYMNIWDEVTKLCTAGMAETNHV